LRLAAGAAPVILPIIRRAMPPGRAHSADGDRHVFFAYALLGLIAIDLAAAAWHRFVRRDRATSRTIDGAPI